jgi:hypothetical protein
MKIIFALLLLLLQLTPTQNNSISLIISDQVRQKWALLSLQQGYTIFGLLYIVVVCVDFCENGGFTKVTLK